MFGSLHLGRILGINVYVHGTFWLLPILILLGGLDDQQANTGMDLAVLFAVFGCVALHELGHAVAASWYGIRTRDITLYPIGGVARLENMPDKPWPEIVVALAGPAVNFAIAAALIGILLSGGGEPSLLTIFLVRVFQANMVLGLFNLIPAFPMDGGRVFRAFIHLFTDRVTATQIAANVGMVMAGLMFLVGLYYQNVMFSVLAVAVFLMGQAELAQVRYMAQRRSRGEWQADDDEWDDVPPPRPRVTIARPIDGWQFDGDRQVWTEYRGGFPVRRWPAG